MDQLYRLKSNQNTHKESHFITSSDLQVSLALLSTSTPTSGIEHKEEIITRAPPSPRSQISRLAIRNPIIADHSEF